MGYSIPNGDIRRNLIYFTERQRFRQYWLWVLLLGVNVLLLLEASTLFLSGQPPEGNPMTTVLIGVGISYLVTAVLFLCRLETSIQGDGVYVRFFPFHLRFKRYPWNSLSNVFVREYRPLLDYGGWGLRLGSFGKGRAYNVSGDSGIQLIFTDGSKLLIGTQKPLEAKEALRRAAHLIDL